jgi:hypothetical protein
LGIFGFVRVRKWRPDRRFGRMYEVSEVICRLRLANIMKEVISKVDDSERLSTAALRKRGEEMINRFKSPEMLKMELSTVEAWIESEVNEFMGLLREALLAGQHEAARSSVEEFVDGKMPESKDLS